VHAPAPALAVEPSAPPRLPGAPLPVRASVGQRVFAGFIAAGCLALLIVAASLNPDPAGMGTHRQLGLPPCGWLYSMGIPCPTCGMTTAFASAAHARPLDALRAQPAGLAGAIFCAVLFWGAAHVALFGSALGRLFDRLLAPRAIWIAGAVLLLGWGYKILFVKGVIRLPGEPTAAATPGRSGPYPPQP
jgi:hypothetical protein